MKLEKTISNSILEENENGITIYATPNSDYIISPVSGHEKANAPFFYQEVSGDFVLRAKVSHDFVSTYDACALLAMDHEKLWAKGCFEMSDTGLHTIVSVMTNERSDDANCVNVDSKEAWIQLSRKGNTFAVHYSLDGKQFSLARLTYLEMNHTIKVGFLAQSPKGNGGARNFNDILFKNETIDDIRKGNL